MGMNTETLPPLRILIADDEPLARLRLRALLDELGGYEIVAEAANGRQVVEICRSLAPDIVLLDIGMPGINGMEAAEKLAQQTHPPLLIFITAYDEYALEAFENEAVDYVLKPVQKDRLDKALRRAKLLYQIPLPNQTEHQVRTHISTTLHGSLTLIPVSRIYYFHAEQKYTAIRWTQGEALIDEALKKLEQEFAGQFLRIHRGTLVAVSYIEALHKKRDGHCYLSIKDIHENLEVSRRHFGTVKRIMQDYRGQVHKE